jgi:putative membrane protein
MAFFGLTRCQVATVVAIIFHSIGLIGILYFDRDFFIRTTPLNLLLMFALLIYTHQTTSRSFIYFFVICFFSGILAELVGTKTGMLFGNYVYGTVLGPAIEGVPWIIGINWFIVMYCSGTAIHTLMHKLAAGKNANELPLSGKLRTVALIIDGATLAVFFDWLMEPVAIKLGYWKWLGDGEIPFYNYLCWFVLSALLLLLFSKMNFYKNNKFAVHLLGIQAMFFMLLRTLL